MNKQILGLVLCVLISSLSAATYADACKKAKESLWLSLELRDVASGNRASFGPLLAKKAMNKKTGKAVLCVAQSELGLAQLANSDVALLAQNDITLSQRGDQWLHRGEFLVLKANKLNSGLAPSCVVDELKFSAGSIASTGTSHDCDVAAMDFKMTVRYWYAEGVTADAAKSKKSDSIWDRPVDKKTKKRLQKIR